MQRGASLQTMQHNRVIGLGNNSRQHLQASREAPEFPGRAENTLERFSRT